MTDDYCDHCDLPLSQCVHGMPKPPPAPVKATPTRAPRASRAAKATTKPVTRRTTTRRYSPSEDLAPLILEVLEDEGGRANAEDVLAGVGVRLAPNFRPGDEEQGPTGEVRWRTAARKARKSLSDDGRLVVPEPGTWALPGR